MPRALLPPDGWDMNLHPVLVDLYLEGNGHENNLRLLKIMNTIRRTDTDELLFSSPPHPFCQYANMRLQNYIRT